MTNLRPYQQTFVNNVRQSLAKHRKIIACLATGGGKTKCFIHITNEAINKGRHVLIISESVNIYKQIKAEIGVCQHIAEGAKECILSPLPTVYVAMSQTLAKRPFILAQLAALKDKLLVITDEAHIATPVKVLKQLPDAYHIGFTATPVAKQAPHLPEMYDDCIVGPQPQELIELGFLNPYTHYERRIVDLTGLKKVGGEFTESSQEKAFEKREVFEGLYDDLLKFKHFKSCMIFCASIKHCASVSAQLRQLGYKVSECHSKNLNSDFELFQFTSGVNNICVSVASLTKGFDHPPIDLIVLNRATLSLPLLLQMIGRGSRLATGKTHFTCLDYGQNGTRHGLWNMDRPYEKLWKSLNKKEKGLNPPPTKDCPKCGYLMLATIMKCPGCGHVFQKTAEDIKKETQLIELTNEFNSLKGKRVSELNPKELALYVRFTNRKPFGKRIARSQGQEFLEQYAKEIGWNYGWWNYIHSDPELEFADIVVR